MNKSCGCGIVIGILLALAVCGGVWYFFYCRNNPDNAEQHFEKVEQGWDTVKHSGDKGLLVVKESFTGKKNIPPMPQDIPATAPVVPAHPEDKIYR